MKSLIRLFVATTLILATACSNANPKKASKEPKSQLPTGAVAMNYQHHLHFDVMLRDSIPARMIFDTGCTNLLLDSTFYADRFASSGNLRRAMLGGAGGGMELATIDAGKWNYKVGEEPMTEDIATVVNLRKIVGEGVDGMFGMVFMQGRRVELNYAENYMRLLPAEEKIGEDFTRITCTWLYNKMRIVLPLSVTLDDGYLFEGKFLVDTGMPGTLSLNSTTATRLESKSRLSGAKSISYTVGGIGGARKEQILKSPQISVGGHTIKDVTITWSSNKEGASAKESYDGLVGNGLLERFDVIFDFAECAVYLRPNENFSKAEANFYGVALTPMTDHWIVNGLLEDGNAARAGLRRSDRIEKINGMRATDPNVRGLDCLTEKVSLSVWREGEIVEIEVNREW